MAAKQFTPTRRTGISKQNQKITSVRRMRGNFHISGRKQTSESVLLWEVSSKRDGESYLAIKYMKYLRIPLTENMRPLLINCIWE